MSRVLAVIPARGGSKGVPRKNIRELAGQPLINFAIGCCRASDELTDYVISTEDDDIRAVAEKAGAKVITRPDETATDAAPTEPCLQDAVRQTDGGWDAVVLVQATCPFRLTKDLDDAIRLWRSTGATGVMSVSKIPGHFHPYWQKKIDAEGKLSSWFTDPDVTDPILETRKYWRRQDLPGDSYWKNGAVYVTTTSVLMNEGNRYGPDCRALVLDDSRLVNIDTLDDFAEAEEALRSGRIELDFSLPA